MRRRLSPIVVFVFHPLRDDSLSHVETVEELAGERRERKGGGVRRWGRGKGALQRMGEGAAPTPVSKWAEGGWRGGGIGPQGGGQ